MVRMILGSSPRVPKRNLSSVERSEYIFYQCVAFWTQKFFKKQSGLPNDEAYNLFIRFLFFLRKIKKDYNKLGSNFNLLAAMKEFNKQIISVHI